MKDTNGSCCGSSKCRPLVIIFKILILVGALNWGLVGFFGFDLVATLFGQMTTLSRVIYDAVALAALLYIIHALACSGCKKACMSCCDDKHGMKK